MEVWGHLVEKDQDRPVAREELEPVPFVGGLGSALPETPEPFRFPQLHGDLAPEEVVWAVAAVEGGHSGRVEFVDVGDLWAIAATQLGVTREEAEADQKVGFTATHGLLEMEGGLGRGPGQPREPLGDQVPHALGDVGPLEKSASVALQIDQLVKLLNLVAQPDLQSVGLKLAGVLDRFYHVLSFSCCL